MTAASAPPPAAQLVVGAVAGVDLTGIGPNSGEITLIIQPDNSPNVVEVFAAIMDSSHSTYSLETGVYASYVSMALAAMSTGRKLQVSYLALDKLRINGMSIR